MPKQSLTVQISNQVSLPKISVPKIKWRARKILKCLGWSRVFLSISFVDDAAIRVLNRDFLGHDRPTDVLAFSQLEGKGPPAKIKGNVFLGDIVISLETACRHASEYGNSFGDEIDLYLCHGILHLMGFGDESPKDARRMSRIQQKVLAATCGKKQEVHLRLMRKCGIVAAQG